LEADRGQFLFRESSTRPCPSQLGMGHGKDIFCGQCKYGVLQIISKIKPCFESLGKLMRVPLGHWPMTPSAPGHRRPGGVGPGHADAVCKRSPQTHLLGVVPSGHYLSGKALLNEQSSRRLRRRYKNSRQVGFGCGGLVSLPWPCGNDGR
jgi:hypothetical protein